MTFRSLTLGESLARNCPELREIPGATDGYFGHWQSGKNVPPVKPDFSKLGYGSIKPWRRPTQEGK